MKAKVNLTYSVTLFVEGGSDDEISDWLAQTTPSEALKQAKEQTGNYVEENYDEQIECFVMDDSEVDLVIE